MGRIQNRNAYRGLDVRSAHFSVILFFIIVVNVCCSCQALSLDISAQEMIDISQEYSIANVDSLVFADLGKKQSMVFYKGNALFLVGSSFSIYSFESGNRIVSFDLPYGEYQPPHANVTNIGNIMYSEYSIFPVIYVSSWNNGRQAFVYDITQINGRYQSNLVQVIDPSKVNNEIIGDGYLDWVIDNEGSYLYSLAYHVKGTSQLSEGNYTHVVKFKLPALDSELIVLNDNDVLDHFMVPVMTVFQDKCIFENHIFVVAGHSGLGENFPPRLYDIDTNSKEMTETILPLWGEPEGFCIYEGCKWMNLYGSNIVYNLTNLFNL